MFNLKNFSKLPITILLVMCYISSLNAFASDPKCNVFPELGGSQSAFTILASRQTDLRNEATNSDSRTTPKDQTADETQDNEICECETPVIISRKEKKKEKQKKYFETLTSGVQELYSDQSYTEFDRPIETISSNSSNLIVIEVSEVRERYSDYIEKTERGNNKHKTLKRAGIDSADKLNRIIKEACEKGRYSLKEKAETLHGTALEMGIDLDDDYILKCGIFCDKKQDCSRKTDTIETDLDIESRGIPLEMNLSADSPRYDSSFRCMSSYEQEESLSQCCSPYLRDYSDCVDSQLINYNYCGSTEKNTSITPTEPRRIFPRLITVVADRKPANFQRNNVVRAKNYIYRMNDPFVEEGTFGVVIDVNHNKYKVLFTTAKGESTIAENIDSSDLELVQQQLKKW